MFAADYERDSFQILLETVFDVCESSHKFIQFIVNSSMSDICHQCLNFDAQLPQKFMSKYRHQCCGKHTCQNIDINADVNLDVRIR